MLSQASSPVDPLNKDLEVNMSIGYDKIREEMPRFRMTTVTSLSELNHFTFRQRMNLNPDYQRGHVWTREQSEDFMGHILEGGACPAFIIHEGDISKDDYENEMVDGQQRARAILGWFDGDIGARLSDDTLVWFKDATPTESRMIRMGITVPINWGQWTRKERLKLYLKLNRGGTVHTESEISRVREMLAAEE